MKAVVFDRIGAPDQVLELRDVPVPDVGDGEALVRMTGASVNPGDFLFIQSLYPEPKKPKLPGQIGGNHGAGIVEKVGRGVDIAPGTLVAFSYYNSWAEYAAVPAEWLIPLPAGYPVEKASQFFNLVTAWDLLADSAVTEGQWLVVTAGNSAVATMVLQFARRRNIKVISVVRAARDLDLRALGAAAVVELSGLAGDIGERIADITGGAGANGLIDCVGGPATGDLIRSLAFGARVSLYGGMSLEPFQLHNFDVLLKDLKIGGHTYRFFFSPPSAADAPNLREIAEISAPEDFRVAVGGIFPIEQYATAIGQTLDRPELGKCILKF